MLITTPDGRYLRGEASSYPGVPEVFGDGLPAAIWV
jgi:hypothetical protein